MIDSIRRQAADLTFKDVLLWPVSLPPFLLGWLVGFGVRAVLWLVAATVAGYTTGRGV